MTVNVAAGAGASFDALGAASAALSAHLAASDPHADRAYAGGTAATSATQYVTTTGNDSNDGLAWGSAKLTVQAAINALPLAADSITRAGVVEIGYGTFDVSAGSYARTDSMTFNATATVTDTSCVATDVGAVINPHGEAGGSVPTGYQIMTVNPGVSFTINKAVSYSGTNSVIVDKAGVTVPPGVTLRGRGAFSGSGGQTSTTQQPTEIKNATGTGSAINGVANGGTFPLYWNNRIADMVLTGNSGSRDGFYCNSAWNLFLERVHFQNHGLWGTYLGSNGTASGYALGCVWFKNGHSAAGQACGGVFTSGSPATFWWYSCNFSTSTGYGTWMGPGNNFFGCAWGGTLQGGTQLLSVPTGVHTVVNQATTGTGKNPFYGCWWDVPGTAGTECSLYLIGSVGSPVVISGSNFDGSANLNYMIGVQNNSSLILDDTDLGPGTSGIIHLEGSNQTSAVYWRQLRFSGTPPAAFITGSSTGYTTGTLVTVAQAQANEGRWQGGSATVPVVASTVTLTSATPWQNTTNSTVLLVIPVTYLAGGTVAIARGPTSTPTSLGTITRAGADTDVLEYWVPSGWYFKPTLTNASFTVGASNNAFAQPV